MSVWLSDACLQTTKFKLNLFSSNFTAHDHLLFLQCLRCPRHACNVVISQIWDYMWQSSMQMSCIESIQMVCPETLTLIALCMWFVIWLAVCPQFRILDRCSRSEAWWSRPVVNILSLMGSVPQSDCDTKCITELQYAGLYQSFVCLIHVLYRWVT